MKRETSGDVRRLCSEFLNVASDFYEVPKCAIRVLAARPPRVRERGTFELFGDYDPDTKLIRVVDANGGAEGGHILRYVREDALPRVLSPSRFPEVRIPRLVAHTRLLRAGGCALPSCEGNPAEEAVLGTRDGRTLANRLAADESKCVITLRIP